MSNEARGNEGDRDRVANAGLSEVKSEIIIT